MAPPELIDEDGLAGLVCEGIPPRHLDKKCEAVGESGIQIEEGVDM
jgi:hypothetical protein